MYHQDENNNNCFEDTIPLVTALFHSGHKKTAFSFLKHKLEIDRHVETLLEWSENKNALYTALESGKSDLIHLVMLKLREKTTSEDFHRTIRNFPVAVTLYKQYCRQFNTQKLYEMYVHEKDFSAQAMALISNVLDQTQAHAKKSLLSSASEAFSEGGDAFNALMCDEQLKLLTFQIELDEKNPNCNYFGKTIHETCCSLLGRDPKAAEEFRKQFQIPERRFWLLKIQTLAEMEDWTSLEKLSKMEECRIGSEKFVDACLQKNNREEALKYFETVREEFQTKYLIKMGFLEEAAKMAFKKKDHFTLLLVKSLCDLHSPLGEEVMSMIKRLESVFWDIKCAVYPGKL